MSDAALESVEWHDAMLDRIQRVEDGARLEFSVLNVYRAVGPSSHDREECSGVLEIYGGLLKSAPPGDERTSKDSRWVMDGLFECDAPGHDVQALMRGVGPGALEFTMSDNSKVSATFASARLTLIGPFTKVSTWRGRCAKTADEPSSSHRFDRRRRADRREPARHGRAARPRRAPHVHGQIASTP